MRRDLIYDVGVDDGADTAYYLSKGYSVVAIEANPASARRAEENFRAEIDAGRLVLLNRAIADAPGEQTFWVCNQHPALSSCDETIVRGSRHVYEPVTVTCVRFADVLEQYGVPHYLKVDIEGSDHLCLRDLDPADPPDYVSFELLHIEDLFLLARCGYDRFKCIRQDNLTQVRRAPPSLGGVRQEFEHWVRARGADHPQLLRLLSTCKGAARKAVGLATGRSSAGGEPTNSFQVGATGPFGEDTHGSWQTLDEVCYSWLELRYKHADGRTLWTDIHAKRSVPASSQTAAAY